MTNTIDLANRLAAVRAEPETSCAASIPFLTVHLLQHPELMEKSIPSTVAMLIDLIDTFDRKLGGEGVLFDPTGTVVGQEGLAIRVLAKSGAGAVRRFQLIEKDLTELAILAKLAILEQQDADINSKIMAELNSPISAATREAVKWIDEQGLRCGKHSAVVV